MACTGCGEQVAVGARFCSVCGAGVGMRQMPIAPPPVVERGLVRTVDSLYRPREGRMVAGVCAGLALRYGWDVTVVRLVLALFGLLGLGLPLLVYAIAWVVMPNGQFALPAQASYDAADSMRM